MKAGGIEFEDKRVGISDWPGELKESKYLNSILLKMLNFRTKFNIYKLKWCGHTKFKALSYTRSFDAGLKTS